MSKAASGKRGSAGWVYALQASGTNLVKIGRTTSSVEKRVQEIQTSSPHRLDLIMVIATADAPTLEQAFHEACAPFRTRGEWFDLPDDSIDALTQATDARVAVPEPAFELCLSGGLTFTCPESALHNYLQFRDLWDEQIGKKIGHTLPHFSSEAEWQRAVEVMYSLCEQGVIDA